MIIKLAVVASLSCLSLTAWAQPVLKVHGSVGFKGLIDPHLAEIQAKCGATLELVANGADNGLIDLIEGKAEVAMISVPLEELAAKLNRKNAGSVDTTKLKTIALGYSQLILVVNTNNMIRKLSDAQACGLISGKIASWKEVGGPDMAVVVVSPPKSSGVRTATETLLLKTEKFASDAKEVVNPRQVLVEVSQNIRSVGPIWASVLNEKVAAITLDTPLQTPMILVFRGEPSPVGQKLAEAVRPFVK